MSDFIQFTQWKQREDDLSRELEQARAVAERVAEDTAERLPRPRWRARIAAKIATTSQAIHSAAAHQR